MSIVNKVQDGLKSSSMAILNVFLRLITGFFLGFVLALIGQEIMGYGTWSLLFLTLIVMSIVVKGMAQWGIAKILIFDLICVLVGKLLSMYILIAP
ncbi:MAG: hypothetical protein ACOYOK_15075 [Pseudobdellovibrionaceae bacterium]